MTVMDFGVCQSEVPWMNTAKIVTTADITRVPQEIAALGATAVRFTCLWIELDPSKNQTYAVGKGAAAWARLDACIDAAEANGLDILLCIEPRTSAMSLTGVSATASNATKYGLLCGAVAARYGDRIKFYEICNEVNSLTFFGSPKTPSKYVAFLREAYNNINPHISTAMILAGALMGAVATGWPTLNCVEWVKAFYDSKPQAYFDALSLHPYMTDGNFNQIPVTPDANPFKNLDGVRALMDANGDSAKKILVSEWGFDSLRTVLGSVTQAELEAEQALKLSQQWNIFQTYVDAGKIYPTVFIYSFRNPQEDTDPLYNYGLTHANYTKKAAWYFVRSLAAPTSFTPPTATATATAWSPTVGVFVDHSHITPPAATAIATAWSPTVIKPIAPPAATVTAQAWPPYVEVLTEAQYVSTGAGDRDTTVADDITLTWSHVVSTQTGGLLLVGLVTSTATPKAWEDYDTLTVSSDLGGTFTRLGSRHISATSQKNGSVHIFGKYTPIAGTHNFTAHVYESDGFTNFQAVAANSLYYRGAAALPTSAFSSGSGSGGSSTQTLTATSAVNNQVFFVFGGNKDFNASWDKTVRHHDGSTVSGDGDYILIGDAAGAPTVTATSTVSTTRYGAVAVDIPSL
jgi:hypothetical protein